MTPSRQSGYLLLAALVLLAVIASLGMVVGRFLVSDARAVNEHIQGGRLLSHALAGMEMAAWDLRSAACDPAALPGVVAGSGGFTLSRQLVENGRVEGVFQNTYAATGTGGRFLITSTATTAPASAHQRTLSAMALCSSGSPTGNLFNGSNAGAWEQSHLLDAAGSEAILVGFPLGDATAMLAGLSCSASADNTTCLDLKRPLSLSPSGGREVWFSARYVVGHPVGGFFSMTIDYLDAQGGSAKVVCATADGDEAQGIPLDEDGAIVCTHSPSGERLDSAYGLVQNGFMVNLGRNLDPARITAMRLRAIHLPEGEELRLAAGCLGPDCTLDMNEAPSVVWEGNSQREMR